MWQTPCAEKRHAQNRNYQRMQHSLHSKEVVCSHVMRSANSEFLLISCLLYQTLNYRIARYPSIADTMLWPNVFLDLSTPVRWSQRENLRGVATSLMFASAPASICGCHYKNDLPMWPIGFMIKFFRYEPVTLENHVGQCCYCSIFLDISPQNLTQIGFSRLRLIEWRRNPSLS